MKSANIMLLLSLGAFFFIFTYWEHNLPELVKLKEPVKWYLSANVLRQCMFRTMKRVLHWCCWGGTRENAVPIWNIHGGTASPFWILIVNVIFNVKLQKLINFKGYLLIHTDKIINHNLVCLIYFHCAFYWVFILQ